MMINFIELTIVAFLIFGCLKPEIPFWVKIILCVYFVFDALGEIPSFVLRWQSIDEDEEDKENDK